LNVRKIAIAALAAGCLSLLPAGAAGEVTLVPESKLVERGKVLYGVYCVGCHGEGLKGDGPVGRELHPRPSDLTRITARHGGEFPFPEVYTMIAGVDDTHGKRDMPRWGFAFQELDSDVNQQDQVRGRILQLIYYLQSVQEDPAAERDATEEE
jgi:mono/diheme cytochrome c family protein